MLYVTFNGLRGNRSVAELFGFDLGGFGWGFFDFQQKLVGFERPFNGRKQSK